MSNENGPEQGSAQNPAGTQRHMLREALKAQQAVIEHMGNQIQHLAARMDLSDVVVDDIAGLAGVSKRVAAIRRQADIDNPGQPVPNPPSEQAYETTEQAITPEARDDVRAPGLTPGSTNDVAAESVSTAITPGTDIPTQPVNDLMNVQAPVAGTETHIPDDQTRIEEDVRISPNASPAVNPEVAFPWVAGPNNSNDGSAPTAERVASQGGGQARTFAAMRLAQLQIEAGIADEADSLTLGQKIASSSATDGEIQSTIATLSRVASASQRKSAQPRMNRSAAVRSAPSLVSTGGAHLGGHSPVQQEVADSDLFD